MKSDADLLLDLLRDADEPLWIAYQTVHDSRGRALSLGEFLSLVSEMMARDLIQVWHADSQTGDRTELFEMPDHLEERYLAASDLGAPYDPLDLMLTLGPKAEVGPEKDWRLRVDFEKGTFVLETKPEAENHAMGLIRRDHPGFRFRIERRLPSRNKIRILGSISRVEGESV